MTTDKGEVLQAPFCIMATGNLSLPRVPDFPGLDELQRPPVPQRSVAGRRGRLLGPARRRDRHRLLGDPDDPGHRRAGQTSLRVSADREFQCAGREPPAHAGRDRTHKAKYRYWRDEARRTPFGIAGHPPPTKSALDEAPEERERNYEQKWRKGGNISFLYAYNDLLVNKDSNETASEFVRNKIRSIVRDPKVAELLAPNDHPIGTKRLCVDTGYFETFNRQNVTLVDVRSDPIVEITPSGLRTGMREFELDDIVFATGFDAMTGALLDIDISVNGGPRLADKWAHGPRTYLGLMTAGIPNLFMITGPGSPGVKSNMIASIEQHVDWIVACLQYLSNRQIRHIEADEGAQDNWVAHVNDVGDATLYPLANSWYVGANIPGKPRVFMPYVAGLDKYRRICDEVAANDYRGFSLN